MEYRNPETLPMNRCSPIARRTLFGLLLLLATTLTSRGDLKEFRIGYQKAAGTLALLRASGSLEKRLQPEGVRVTWSKLTAGPQLLEGLNASAIDFGYVGGKCRPFLLWPVEQISFTPPMSFRLPMRKEFWWEKTRRFRISDN